MSTEERREPTEEELRARLEEELKRIRVEDVLLQTAVTLINLGGQRLGLTEQGREGRDLEQTRLAIEAVRALMPIFESSGGEAAQAVRPLQDALAQLQMAYAREAHGEAGEEGGEGPGGGPPPAGGEGPPGPDTPGAGGPGGGAQQQGGAGRLWVPRGST